MKRRFLMYCSALALMATAVFTGSTISYGQENSEISDFGDGADTEIYSELSECELPVIFPPKEKRAK